MVYIPPIGVRVILVDDSGEVCGLLPTKEILPLWALYGGGLQRLDDRVFLLAPRNVELSGDGADEFLAKGFVNQV
jgi:hypothetical protein